MRYQTLLEQTIDEWEDGHGVVQIVSPESVDENRLRFGYYKDGESVNRPLTLTPSAEAADQTTEAIETMAGLARTFTDDEIEALVEELGEDKILELSVLIEELGKSRLLEILQESTDGGPPFPDQFRDSVSSPSNQPDRPLVDEIRHEMAVSGHRYRTLHIRILVTVGESGDQSGRSVHYRRLRHFECPDRNRVFPDVD